MESQNLLSELADIHLPSSSAFSPLSSSFWPPAVGWWILICLILITCYYLVRVTRIRQNRQKHLSNALSELQSAYKNHSKSILLDKNKNRSNLAFLNEVNAILRRVALVRCAQTTTNQKALPQLSGTAWLRFLDSCDNNTDFSTGPGKVLGEGIYQPHFETNVEAVYQLAQQWIQNRYRGNLKASKGIPA